MSEKVEVSDNNQITKFEEPNGEPTCSIVFENNPNRVYYTGQVVNGCVHLAINEPTVVRAIYANIVGRGYCKWIEGSKHTSTYSKEEVYFSRKIYYVGSQNNQSDCTTVESGDYKYLFDCNIPDECHTSVEERKGFIRYSVTVVIEEDVDKKKEFVESFTVLNPLNLNDDESNSYPQSDEGEFIFTKYCCCLCCWLTEPAKISAKVPMKGYAPGQAIEITINVDNKSNHTYDNFTGIIFKKVEFYANDRTWSSTDKLATFTCEGCKAGEQLSRKLIVTVPPTARTEKSNICSISYHLTVESFVGCNDDENLKFEFLLVIGTYPVQNTQTGDMVISEQPTKSISNNGEHLKAAVSQTIVTSSDKKENIIDRLVPDYQVGESIQSDKELAGTYRPMYPMYINKQCLLACTVTVEPGEVKPIKM
ncbi:arrestin domain-containing protein 3-like [Bradysia coprophila]|uniref:arrestin domain-containing protein 3-like n=1 Tax=Bradysia coprophila TaxID=38358 RepID=UPI00187D88FC|nr:arrestin domain-containing protein 3-like [Bradysia coprophila]